MASPLRPVQLHRFARDEVQRRKAHGPVGAAADARKVQGVVPAVDVDGVERLLEDRALLLLREACAPRRRTDDVVAVRGVARLCDVPEPVPVCLPLGMFVPGETAEDAPLRGREVELPAADRRHAARLVRLKERAPRSERLRNSAFAADDFGNRNMMHHHGAPSGRERHQRVFRKPHELPFAHAVLDRPVGAVRADGVRRVRHDVANARSGRVEPVVASLGVVGIRHDLFPHGGGVHQDVSRSLAGERPSIRRVRLVAYREVVVALRRIEIAARALHGLHPFAAVRGDRALDGLPPAERLRQVTAAEDFLDARLGYKFCENPS